MDEEEEEETYVEPEQQTHRLGVGPMSSEVAREHDRSRDEDEPCQDHHDTCIIIIIESRINIPRCTQRKVIFSEYFRVNDSDFSNSDVHK